MILKWKKLPDVATKISIRRYDVANFALRFNSRFNNPVTSSFGTLDKNQLEKKQGNTISSSEEDS